MEKGKIKIFYSYCHKDSDNQRELDKHLRLLKDKGIIETWHYKEIQAGDRWQKEIDQHLIEADIVLFLLSVDFLDSDGCKSELKQAKDEGKKIIPIILKDCPWKDFTFDDGEKLGDLLAIPSNKQNLQPVSKWEGEDEAWMAVYEELKDICEEESFIKNIELTDKFKETLNDCGPLIYSHRNKAALTLDDIFVWPEFEKSKDSDIQDSKSVSEKDLFKDIDASNKIWIIGEDQSGKTSLATKIFWELRKKGLIPVIFLSPYKGIFNNQLKKNMSKQYKDSNRINDRHRDKIVPIIDDFHKYSNQSKLLMELKNYSKHILITDKVFPFNFRNKNLKDIEGSHYRYEITEFYATKRNELIEKWLAFKEDTDNSYKSLDEQTDKINCALGKISEQGIVPSYPVFILTIISHSEAWSKPLDSNITSQGHCYYVLIYQHFIEHNLDNAAIGAYLNFLYELAYHFHKKDIDEMSEKQLKDFIEQDYKENYRVPDKTDALINKLKTMGILTRSGLGNYSFRYKYFFYYFVAKYITEHLQDCMEEVDTILAHLHKDENAYIAIFMCHHSRNNKILEHFWLNANMLFEKYQPATLNKDEVSFIDEKISEAIQVVLPSTSKPEEERKEHLDEQDKHERNSANQQEIDEESDDTLLVELRKCIKTAEVMGHIIRNRSGSLEKDRIKSIFQDAMNIHLRILSVFFTFLKEGGDQYLEEYLTNKIQEQAKKRKHDLPRDKARKDAREILMIFIFGIIFGIMGKIVSSLGADELSDFIREVCDKINTPASWLVKRGILMQYSKELPPIKEIDKESKNFSRIARKIRDVMIVHHCRFHGVGFRDKQRIKQILGIPIIPSPKKE